MLLGGGFEAGDVAPHFGVPVEQLEAEGRRLGVDAVGSPDRGSVLEFEGAPLEDREQAYSIAVGNDGRGRFDLQRLRGVDDIVRSEPVVQPARFGADLFGDRGGEGDDVVPDFGLDLLNSLNVNLAAGI